MKNRLTVPENAHGKRVKKVEKCGTADVYNMTVDGCHNYAIGSGLIVHNCESARYGLMSRPIAAHTEKQKPVYQYDPLDLYKPSRRTDFFSM